MINVDHYKLQRPDATDIKKNIIAYRADRSACWYYRIHQPLSFLTRFHNDYSVQVFDFMDKRHIGQFDIAILQRQYKQEVYDVAKQMKDAGTTLVYELDDDLFHIPQWNPAYKVYNKKTVGMIEKFMELVDAVFVSTGPLAEVCSKFNNNVHVLPNSVAFEIISDRPYNSKKPVVCWQGSPTHKKDLKIIDEAIKKLVKRKDIMVKMWSVGKTHGTYQVPVVEFYAFHNMMSQVDIDVGLAPLVPTQFNKSKSNLKYLEYSAHKTATVASNFGPYKETIEDGVTGFVVDNFRDWHERIMHLIEDVEARAKMAEAAYQFTKDNYDLNDVYKKWKNAIDELTGGIV